VVISQLSRIIMKTIRKASERRFKKYRM